MHRSAEDPLFKEFESEGEDGSGEYGSFQPEAW